MKFIASASLMCILFLCTQMSMNANTDSRVWTMENKEIIYAELVHYDPANKTARLHKNNVYTEYKLSEFSVVDQAWLKEWAEVSAELGEISEQMEGEFSHYQTEGVYKADFYVYTPKLYETNKNLPILFLFHPSGKGIRYVQRMMQSAEALGIIVASTDAFRNTGKVWAQEDQAMLEAFQEIWNDIESYIPHDKNNIYLGGTSGGAMAAYQYSGKFKRKWTGIWANGGWLGGPKYYNWKYGKNMRIAMVNGNTDYVNKWVKSDTKVFEKNNCEVKLFSFEGGHAIPGPMTQFKSLMWLLGRSENNKTTGEKDD